MPLNRIDNHFIRFDKRNIIELGIATNKKRITKNELDKRENSWWLDDIVNIYSPNANIRQLIREKDVRI